MSGRWRTIPTSPDILLIQNGDVVVGSIALLGRKWCAEILWSGPGEDIKAEFSDYGQVLAFVLGVEKTLSALGVTDPRMAALVHGEPRQQ